MLSGSWKIQHHNVIQLVGGFSPSEKSLIFSQIGLFPQVAVEIEDFILQHHLDYCFLRYMYILPGPERVCFGLDPPNKRKVPVPHSAISDKKWTKKVTSEKYAQVKLDHFPK